MKLPKTYILKDRQIVPATMRQWGDFMSSFDRVVAQSYFGEVRVSTVFLGVEDLFFETMVFDGPMAGHQERCSTWQEAEEIHERVCREVRQRMLQ